MRNKSSDRNVRPTGVAAVTGQERSFPLLFYLLTPFLALGLTLGSVELVLALVWPQPFAAEVNMYYVADPHTGFRLKPGSTGRFFPDIVTRVNSHGHRDDEVSLAKPPGTLRILVLGDSFTMGANVRQLEIYTEVLEELLVDELGRSVEVVNTGVGGWHPFHYAQYYLHYGWRFEPDLVLIGLFVGNDAISDVRQVEDSRTAFFGRRVRRDSAERSPWLTRIRVVFYTRSHLARLLLNPQTAVLGEQELAQEDQPRDGGQFSPLYLEVQRRRLLRNHLVAQENTTRRLENCVRQISRIRDRAARDGAPVVVALIPDENQVNRSLADAVFEGLDRALFDLAMPQLPLISMFQEERIPVIDLLPDFLTDPRRLYMNDTHWSPGGHRLAAERLFAELLPLVQSTPTQ